MARPRSNVDKALREGHPETLEALQTQLSRSMRECMDDGKQAGLVPQVAAQLIKVVAARYEESLIGDAAYLAVLEQVCQDLAKALDSGVPSVQAQTASVFLKAEGMLDEARSALPQETNVDKIIARKPTSDTLVSARRR